MAKRGRPPKPKVPAEPKKRGRPPKAPEDRKQKPPPKKRGLKPSPQVMQVMALAGKQCIRYRYATDRESYNAYYKLRAAVKRYGREDITVHKEGHTICVFT